jgi:hypothetical protein
MKAAITRKGWILAQNCDRSTSPAPDDHLDKHRQGRIDDLGAPDFIRVKMSLRSHDHAQAI